MPFKEGGLNIPNIKFKVEALHLYHLYKFVNGHSAIWTHFAKYWLSVPLRKYNKSLFSNNAPHSETIPAFYTDCLNSLSKITKKYPQFDFKNCTTKIFYNMLLSLNDTQVRAVNIFPHIDFKQVFNNLYLPCIDPCTRNTCWRICHDTIYVNYYLFVNRISKNKTCPLCKSIETVSHLIFRM